MHILLSPQWSKSKWSLNFSAPAWIVYQSTSIVEVIGHNRYSWLSSANISEQVNSSRYGLISYLSSLKTSLRVILSSCQRYSTFSLTLLNKVYVLCNNSKSSVTLQCGTICLVISRIFGLWSLKIQMQQMHVQVHIVYTVYMGHEHFSSATEWYSY